jgi:hypothetical protein
MDPVKHDLEFVSTHAKKMQFKFLRDGVYYDFIKKCAPELSGWAYYAVTKSLLALSADGPMQLISVSGDLENPEYEPIATAVVNGMRLYLWRDRYWMEAITEHGMSTAPKLDHSGGLVWSHEAVEDLRSVHGISILRVFTTVLYEI